MAIDNPNAVYDGFSNLAGGADAGRRANLIDPTQFVEGENLIVRGGSVMTRPPIVDVALTFDNPDLTYKPDGTLAVLLIDIVPDDSPTHFAQGLFQNASYYAPSFGHEYLMVSIAGRLYRITPSDIQTAHVREVPLSPGRNQSDLPIGYHLQSDVYHITQDGSGSPIIYDGSTARRAIVNEIPTGLMMGYGQGRIVQVLNNGDIEFGDIFDGKGNAGADVLGFTETQFLNEGFPSRLPPSMGMPTAVQFVPQQDSSTGVGECLVTGQRGIESFFLSLPRDQWKDSQFQRTALLQVGNCSHRSIAVANQDIWFRNAADGWRSYRQARAEINQWAQLPMSTNIRQWTDSDTPSLLNYCSCIWFNDRLIATSNPVPNQGRLYHNGLVSLDFDVLATFGQSSNPGWDGHWGLYNLDALTGLKVLQLVEGTFAGRHRAFAFALNADGENIVQELMPVPLGEDSAGPVTARLVSRSLDFKSEMNEKNLFGGDIWIDQIKQDTDFSFRYKPDQVPQWSDWDSFTVAPITGAFEGGAPIQRDGYDPRHSISKPDESTDDLGTGRSNRRGYEFQAEITWSGRATVRKFRAAAETEIERSGPNSTT